MYLKNEKNCSVLFQYLKQLKSFFKHLKTVYSQIKYADSENAHYF